MSNLCVALVPEVDLFVIYLFIRACLDIAMAEVVKSMLEIACLLPHKSTEHGCRLNLRSSSSGQLVTMCSLFASAWFSVN